MERCDGLAMQSRPQLDAMSGFYTVDMLMNLVVLILVGGLAMIAIDHVFFE